MGNLVWLDKLDKERAHIRQRALKTSFGKRYTFNHINDYTLIFDYLKEEIPKFPWIVLIDGEIKDFSIEVCKNILSEHSCKIWNVTPYKPRDVELDSLRLDPNTFKDTLIINNLIPDLTIIPKDNLIEVVLDRWINTSRYILLEESEPFQPFKLFYGSIDKRKYTKFNARIFIFDKTI